MSLDLPSWIPPEKVLGIKHVGAKPCVLWNCEAVVKAALFDGSWQPTQVHKLTGQKIEPADQSIAEKITGSVLHQTGPFITVTPKVKGGAKPDASALQDGQHLLNWINNNPKAEGLIISDMQIGDDGMTALAYGLRYSKVHTLWVDGCGISERGMQQFARRLPELPITWLDLQRNKLGHALKTLAKHLPYAKVSNLNLNHSGIDLDGILTFASVLPYSQVLILHMSHNQIGPEGMRALAPGILGSNVMKLNLASNLIGDVGVKALAPVISSVCHLFLANNRITDSGLKVLAPELPKTGITLLDLSNNRITSSGVKALITHLPHSWVVNLKLANNNLDQALLGEINHILKSNEKKIRELFTALNNSDPSLVDRFQHTPHTLLDLEDNTPLHYAIKMRNYPLAKLLIDKGAIQSFNRTGATPKSLAGDDETLKTLLADQNFSGRYQLALEKKDDTSILKSGMDFTAHLMTQSHYHSALNILNKIEPIAISETKIQIALRQAICHRFAGDSQASHERTQYAISLSSNLSFIEFLQAIDSAESVKLDKLDLQNGLAQAAIDLLRAYGQKAKVAELKLGANCLDHQFFSRITEHFIGVKKLSLWSCHLYDKDAKAIAKTLDQYQLTYLSLAANHFTCEGIAHLVPQLKSIDCLDLWANTLRSEGVSLLLRAFENSTAIKELDLAHCGAGSQVLEDLCCFLSKNRSLVRANIGMTELASDQISKLNQALAENYSCTSLGTPLDALLQPIFKRNAKVHEQFLQAAMCADTYMLHSLSLKAIPWNITDQEGNTALHLATERSQYSAITYLLDKNLHHLRNDAGQTPMDIAKMRRDSRAVKLLGGEAISPILPMKIYQPRFRIVPRHLLNENLDIQSADNFDQFQRLMNSDTKAIKITGSENFASEAIESLVLSNQMLTYLDLSSHAQLPLPSLLHALKGCPNLKVLNLSNQALEKSLDHLCELISSHAFIQEINVANCSLDLAAFEALCRAIKQNLSLRKLVLNGNLLQGAQLRALKNALESHPTLYRLEMENCQLDQSALAELIAVNSNIRFIDLRHNRLNCEVGSPICKALEQRPDLIYLGLRSTTLKDADIVGLCQSLKRSKALAFLDLSINTISPEKLAMLDQLAKTCKTTAFIYATQECDALKQTLQINRQMQDLALSSSMEGKLSILKECVKQGLTVNICDENFNSCLHYAALNGHLEMAQWLIDQNCLITLNRSGLSPLDIAIEQNQPEICLLFKTIPQPALSASSVEEVDQQSTINHLNNISFKLETAIEDTKQRLSSIAAYCSVSAYEDLQKELSQLKKELILVKVATQQQKLLKERLSTTLAKEEIEDRQCLQNFYYSTRNHFNMLISDIFNSKPLLDQPEIKRTLLNCLASIASQAFDIFSTESAIQNGMTLMFPFIPNPTMTCPSYRGTLEVNGHYEGSQFDLKNTLRLVTYTLTISLKEQILACNQTERKTILDFWMCQFIKQVLSKQPHNLTLHELTRGLKTWQSVDVNTSKIITKEQTQWHLKDLFLATGIAYPEDNCIVYESAQPTTQSELGYLHFDTKQIANLYKCQRADLFQDKEIVWQKDKTVKSSKIISK